MKLTVYHEDAEVLARMAERLAKEFHPPLILLDPSPEVFPLSSGAGPEPALHPHPEEAK